MKERKFKKKKKYQNNPKRKEESTYIVRTKMMMRYIFNENNFISHSHLSSPDCFNQNLKIIVHQTPILISTSQKPLRQFEPPLSISLPRLQPSRQNQQHNFSNDSYQSTMQIEEIPLPEITKAKPKKIFKRFYHESDNNSDSEQQQQQQNQVKLKYQCIYCDIEFSTKTALVAHCQQCKDDKNRNHEEKEKEKEKEKIVKNNEYDLNTLTLALISTSKKNNDIILNDKMQEQQNNFAKDDVPHLIDPNFLNDLNFDTTMNMKKSNTKKYENEFNDDDNTVNGKSKNKNDESDIFENLWDFVSNKK
jgi:hypothetical protein